jgi:hypothetical protein
MTGRHLTPSSPLSKLNFEAIEIKTSVPQSSEMRSIDWISRLASNRTKDGADLGAILRPKFSSDRFGCKS